MHLWILNFLGKGVTVPHTSTLLIDSSWTIATVKINLTREKKFTFWSLNSNIENNELPLYLFHTSYKILLHGKCLKNFEYDYRLIIICETLINLFWFNINLRYSVLFYRSERFYPNIVFYKICLLWVS